MRSSFSACALAASLAACLVAAAPVQAQEAAAEVPVEIAGTPDGATVTVDRVAIGALPSMRGALAPGLHYFVVTAPGYYREMRDVTVEREPLSLRFDLVLDPAMQPRGADLPMIVGGSVLTLGGAAALVLAIVGATGDRRCVARCDEIGGRHIVEKPAIDAIVAWAVAGGIAAIVGPILIFVGATSNRPARGAVSLGLDGLAVTF